ncbi:L-methionine/branched-chain amino acid transporter [Celerinatantimonas sp. YJH-8]|uniref:L-methionine/branched-chain amino acid transporter n=1 Tax=Celerinatantimonas sp. YJH-8 TaxID=3228714 RepID=UPI0038C455B6
MTRLKPQLNLFQGIGLLVTTLLGTGIFVVPGLSAQMIGHQSLLAWAILLMVTLPIALTFASLGKRYPHAGGVPHVVGQAFGRGFEKYCAFLFISILPVGIPASLIIGTGFITAVIPLSPLAILAVQILMLVGMFTTGFYGSNACAKMQTPIAIFIMVLVVLLLGNADLKPADVQVHWQFNTPLLKTLGIMFWCIIGLEAFVHLGEEFKKPQRDFPLALILGTIITLALYWCANVVVLKYSAQQPLSSQAGSLPAIASQLFGPKVGLLVSTLGFLSCFACTNTYIQGAARLLWSLAQEQKLPTFMAQLNRHQAPLPALLVTTGFIMLMTWLIWFIGLDLSQLLLYCNGSFIAIYLLAMLAGCTLLKGFGRGLAIFSAIICIIFMWSLGTEIGYLLIFSMIFIILQWIQRYHQTHRLTRQKITR